MRGARSLIAIMAGVLLAVATVSTASASADEQGYIDPHIAQMLEEVPGGVLLDADHAVWPALSMEMIVPTSSSSSSAYAASSVGSCASGQVCLYSGYSLSGTQLNFGTCGIHTVPGSFTARSLAHARSSGYTQARNGTTVLATAYVGGWTNIVGTTTNIRCVF